MPTTKLGGIYKMTIEGFLFMTFGTTYAIYVFGVYLTNEFGGDE